MLYLAWYSGIPIPPTIMSGSHRGAGSLSFLHFPLTLATVIINPSPDSYEYDSHDQGWHALPSKAPL